jgi:hypothetical protein
MVDESNYATVKNLCDEDLELMDEESHYALVRKPDGRADEPTYSTLRENQRAPSDDAGYESLHNQPHGGRPHLPPNRQPIYAGIDSRKSCIHFSHFFEREKKKLVI